MLCDWCEDLFRANLKGVTVTEIHACEPCCKVAFWKLEADAIAIKYAAACR